jgi:MFS family permease
MLFGLSFGALLILYPVVASELFGTKYLGTNYGLLFSSYGIGGFLGPVIFGKAYDFSSSYLYIFILAAAACTVAGFLVLSLTRMEHVNQKG